jgi:hypothetical protein
MNVENFDIPEGVVEEEQDTIYLSGPIRKADDNGRNWREELIDDYSDKFDFINPLDRYNPDEHKILNDPIHLSEDCEKNQVLPSEYVLSDKMGIRQAEFLFVGLPEIIARGTCMECQYASMNDTPIFVWTMDQQEESGWLYSHAEVMYDDRDALMEYIENYE